MAQTRQEFPPKIVDSAASLESFIDELINQVEYSNPKTLYLDLEGINLSRHGTISILTLLVNDSGFHPDRIYLIDIHTLGSSAFTTPVFSLRIGLPRLDHRCKTLKDILESPMMSKVVFDVRNDADALFSNFGIRMQCVMDLQLMENAAREGSVSGKKYLHGLGRDKVLAPVWPSAKYARGSDDLDDFLESLDDYDDDDDWDRGEDDTARDCIGWEEDMDKNGEFYI